MSGIASRGQLRMTFLRTALICVPLILFLGTLSGQLARSGYGNPWFDALAKPGFMPAGWVFGAAWTLLYILLGLVLALFLHARGARLRGWAIALFLVQLACNYAWSPLFFSAHEVRPALALLVVMIFLTLFLIVIGWWIRRVASLLLLPYLAWLFFAFALTNSILHLNPRADRLAPAGPSTDIPLAPVTAGEE